MDADGFPRAVNGRSLPIPGRRAAIPVRPDHRGVHPRTRPFPGGPLVRREGQGLLDRLRQGDLRLLRPLRDPLALRLGTARRLRQVPGRREQRQRAIPGCPGTHDAGRARRSVPDQVIGGAGGHRGGRADRQFPAGDCDLYRVLHGDGHARDGAARRRAAARRRGGRRRLPGRRRDPEDRRPAGRDLQRHAARCQRQRRQGTDLRGRPRRHHR